ncbi:MAG: potassium channel family protein [Anaerolineales bacterium]
MAVTQEQQQALDELMSHMRKPAEPDILKTWLGFSREELREKVLSLLDQKSDYQQHILDWIESNPMDASLEIIGAASWAFYLAEKDFNPRIKSYVDAFYYISTCASVGYADIFAATQAGRAIAALVMIIGPALTANSLNRPKSKQP